MNIGNIDINTPGTKPSPAMTTEFLQTLLDDLSVRNISAAFTDAIIRHDYEAFRTYWIPDAVWEIKNPLPSKATGVDNIVTMLQGLLERFEFFVQMIHSGVVKVEGDQAAARWIVQEIGRGKEGSLYYNNYAVYDDLLVRDGDEWKFARRTYNYLYLDNAAFSGKAYALPSDLLDESQNP